MGTWQTGVPPVDEAIEAEVEVRTRTTGRVRIDTFLCFLSEWGDVCDLQYGDDIGWTVEDLLRWRSLPEAVAMQFE